MTIKTPFYVLFLSLMALTIPIRPYAQTFEWAGHMGGSDWDKGVTIATNDNGDIYCAGNFRGTVDFDPGPGVAELTSGGTQDVFLTKFSPGGSLEWVVQLGDTAWEEVNDLTLDANGNIYLTGFFLGKMDLDPGPGTHFVTSSMGGDAFICKLDPNGNFLWGKQLGGNLAVETQAITVDDSGYVYTTGYFDGTADLDPGPGTASFTVIGYSDMFISKLDSSGNHVWAKRFGGPQGEIGHSITVDDNGNVYTTGTFVDSVDFDPGPGNHYLYSGGPGEQEIFVSKLDASGSFQWVDQIGGDVGYSITTDNAGNIYTTGYYGWGDISITKFHPSGTITWSKEIGAFVGYSLDVDEDHNVYITGQFNNTRDFDPDTSTYELTAIGSTDSYVLELDASGKFVRVGQLGGTDEVHIFSLALDSNKNIYTTGYFNGTADFDPGPGTYDLTSNGGFDIFIQKLASTPTGYKAKAFQNGFLVYPNPTNGEVFIEFDHSRKAPSLTLRSIRGRTIKKMEFKDNDPKKVRIPGPPGVYLLELVDANGRRTIERIVKD